MMNPLFRQSTHRLSRPLHPYDERAGERSTRSHENREHPEENAEDAVAYASNQPLSAAMRTASDALRAPVLPIAEERWLRTVPSERCRRAATSAVVPPCR